MASGGSGSADYTLEREGQAEQVRLAGMAVSITSLAAVWCSAASEKANVWQDNGPRANQWALIVGRVLVFTDISASESRGVRGEGRCRAQ